MSEILNGWKAIADFLGIHEETAKAWESKYKLPIQRPAGRAVMAVKVDMVKWIKKSVTGQGK